MATSNAQSRNSMNVTYTYTTVPTQFVEANGIKFAYRSYGKKAIYQLYISTTLRPT